jgi:hypothetical protein
MWQALGVTAAAALVYGASVLPWATVLGTARPLPERLAGEPLRVEATVNAWNSHVRYGDVTVPNVFVVVAAFGAAVACWIGASGARNAASIVASGLALCGLVHTLCFLAILMRSRSGIPEAGALLTAGAMLILLVLTLLPRRTGQVTGSR